MRYFYCEAGRCCKCICCLDAGLCAACLFAYQRMQLHQSLCDRTTTLLIYILVSLAASALYWWARLQAAVCWESLTNLCFSIRNSHIKNHHPLTVMKLTVMLCVGLLACRVLRSGVADISLYKRWWCRLASSLDSSLQTRFIVWEFTHKAHVTPAYVCWNPINPQRAVIIREAARVSWSKKSLLELQKQIIMTDF